MTSWRFLLLLGSVLAFAENAGAHSPPMHDSGLVSPPRQQGDASSPVPDVLTREAYMLSDNQVLKRLLSRYVSNVDSSQPYIHIPEDDLPQIATQLAQQALERIARNRRLCAARYFGGKKGISYFVAKQAVGWKPVPVFIDKISAVPMLVRKRRIADLLPSGSNMKSLYASPLGRISAKDDSNLAIPVIRSSGYSQNAENDFLKRNMYPALYFIGKGFNTPLFIGKRQLETMKIHTANIAFFRAIKITGPRL